MQNGAGWLRFLERPMTDLRPHDQFAQRPGQPTITVATLIIRGRGNAVSLYGPAVPTAQSQAAKRRSSWTDHTP
jgi:hypothetical protein